MGKLPISEIVLFDEPSNKWRATRRVMDVFKWWVSTNLESTKQWVDLKSMRAWNRILKVILTNDQGRDKGNTEWMRIRKSRCVESDQTHCCTEKFNIALSLCRVLGVTLYFSKGFLEAVAEVPWSAFWSRSPACGLLHCNRGTGCFWDTSCTRYWSTCHC